MKRMLAMILALALVLTWMPALSQEAHAEEIASAGDHLTWTLNEGGTLTISGTGAMSDYRSDGTAPLVRLSGICQICGDRKRCCQHR